MKVTHTDDPVAFRALVEDYLLADEPRHNLMLGLLGTLVDQPDVYPEHHFWSVTDDGGQVVLAALITPPFNLIISKPLAEGAVDALADALVGGDVSIPGVVAALPEADQFVAAFSDRTGVSVGSRQEQAIHVLEQVDPPPRPPGAPRKAGPDDIELALAWHKAFSAEAGASGPYDEAQARRRLAHRLAEEAGEGIRLWEDGGEPVSLVGFAGATASTARIAPVYTPPELRRRGYATALTAHVSQELLDRGRRYCMLYTDLANPTSNAIYARVGYRRVCDSAMVKFEDAGTS